MINFNGRSNIYSIIRYNKVTRHHELVILREVDPNDKELLSFNLAIDLDKQYVLNGYHCFKESRRSTTTTLIFGGGDSLKVGLAKISL